MADGTNGDPVILDPAYRFAVKLLTSLFSHDDDVTKFVRAASPLIRSNVEPGQCFAFKSDTARVFRLHADEDGALYFVRWPGLNGFPKYYLYREEEERPWLQDRINELNRRVGELNPFSAMQKFME
jgi:hypothetical protein